MVEHGKERKREREKKNEINEERNRRSEEFINTLLCPQKQGPNKMGRRQRHASPRGNARCKVNSEERIV